MNLLSAIEYAASVNDHGITFVQPDVSEVNVPYSEIYRNALRILGVLQRRGLGSGDELIILTEDNQLFLYLFWACILGKIIAVPLSAGSNEEHKKKFHKIWHRLSRPFVICDEGLKNSLLGTASTGHSPIDLEAMRDRTLFLREVLSDQEAGIVARVTGQDIAYLQFSSGSTGDPKGVCLTHDNLICNIGDIIDSLAITHSDILCSWMPLTHDMGMIGFHLTGVVKNIDTVSIPTHVFIRKPRIWMDKASACRATVLYSPNFGLHYFLSAIDKVPGLTWDLSGIRILVNGAEDISARLCDRFTSALEIYGLRKNVIVAAYGLAEASVEVSSVPAGAGLTRISLNRGSLNIGDRVATMEEGTDGSIDFVEVGYPIRSCRVRICGEGDQPLPEDMVGHIQIKGDNVTSGYYNDKEATDQLFTRDLWLRTGDVGFLRGGRLVITGRLKNIIILNGQNYYPHDIERQVIDAGIAELGKVVACGAKDPISGGSELIIFILYKASPEDFARVANAIRKIVSDNLGIFVNNIIPVRKIPKTTSGKIQHFILIQQYQNGEFDGYVNSGRADSVKELQDIWRGSNGSMQKEIARIAGLLLGRDPVDADMNFFESGMNSLVAMQFAGRIRELTGLAVSVQDVLQGGTVNELHKHLLLAGRNESRPKLSNAGSCVSFDLSPAQKRIWMEYELDKTSVAYNVPLLFRIKGGFEIRPFRDAVRKLIDKYEILRTWFSFAGDRPMQVVHAPGDLPFAVQYLDLSGSAGGADRAALMCEREANTPFVLEIPSQLRVLVVRQTEDTHFLLFVFHHILIDGWSLGILMAELSKLYNAQAYSSGPSYDHPTSFQFSDYITWHKKIMVTESMAASRSFWAAELNELPDPVGLSGRSKMQTGNISRRVSHYRHSFSQEEFSILKELAFRSETTPFVILMALLNVLLYRYTNQTDIVLGFDVAGRDTEEMESLVGYALNTLCLRVPINGKQTFAELVNLVRQKHYAALNHQQYPFEELLQDRHSNGDGYGNPFFSILVLYQNFYSQDTGLKLSGCSATRQYVNINDGFVDLLLEFAEENETLDCLMQYAESIYSADEIKRMFSHLCNLLAGVAHNHCEEIASYEILTHWEKNMVFPSQDTEVESEFGRMPVHLLFERRVRIWPDAIAVRAGMHAFTYRDINHRANAIANLLISNCKAGPEDRIALLVDRNQNMIITMLAILKAGAAFVAIDPELSSVRQREIAADSGIKYVLVDNTTSLAAQDLRPDHLLINIDDEDLRRDANENPVYNGSMDTLAYVIYTSGSTGKPKGVMIEHRSLFNYVRYFIRYFGITKEDVFVQQASVAFDTFIEEIFPALCSSGTVVIAKDGGKNVDGLLSLIECHGVTVLSTTPLVLNEINNRADDRVGALRLVISGGDILYPSHVEDIIRKTAVYNTYGPSEATVCVGYKKVASLEEASLIGIPIAHCHIYILDENKKSMPVGRTGEIYIEGNLARGYLNEPAMTADKFIENPYYPGRRLYRSGDLGRWRDDGNIEFAGRADHQVKVRGHRVEPEEIERVICQYAGVETAIVVLGKEDGYLVAWLTVQENFQERGLRAHISQSLVHYMIPYRFEIVDRMPLTATGKADRNLLKTKARSLPEIPENQDGPIDDLEQKLLILIAQIPGMENIRRTTNFFEHGCNSIKAARMALLIRKDLQYETEIKDVFIYPTVGLLAERIRKLKETPYSGILPIGIMSDYELSPAQERLWILSRLDKESFAYNESEFYQIDGDLDPERARWAFELITARHEIMRTQFRQVDGVPRQFIRDADPATLNMIAADMAKGEDAMARAMYFIETQTRLPFDLEQGPLYRIFLIKAGEDKHLLAVIMHHIITDDRTCAILIDEFMTLYRAFPNAATYVSTAPKLQYKDYVYWANRRIRTEGMRRERDYWMDLYKDEIPVLDLPADDKRPAMKKNEGGAVFSKLNADLLTQLHFFCNEQQGSLFMLLISGLSILLSKYTGQQDMIIGVPVAGRDHPDLGDIAGFFINTLPVRVKFQPEEDLAGVFQKAKQACLDAYNHQSYPFDHLIHDMQLARDLSRSPFFDVLINLRTLENNENDFPVNGLRFTKMNKKGIGSKYDLAFYIEEGRDGLSCMIEYDRHLFSSARMEHMMEHYTSILQLFADRTTVPIAHLPYLTVREKWQVSDGFNRPLSTFTEEPVTGLFLQQIAACPDKIAVYCGDRTFTYLEINRLSDGLAEYLVKSCQVHRNDRVCLLLDRSEYILISILAVWKAGAVYCPIDPGSPARRMGFILADTLAKVVLTDRSNLHRCEELKEYAAFLPICVDSGRASEEASGHRPAAQADIAYIMYTSGSTGAPKGVEVYHHAVANLVSALKRLPGMSSQDTLLSVSAYTFDISVAEFFLPLICGASLVLATRMEVLDTIQLKNLFNRYRPSYMQATPGLWSQLVDSGWMGSSQLKSITCGESLSDDLRMKLLDRSGELWNMYGPTETTIFSTGKKIVEKNGIISIGTPIQNTRIYIFDEFMEFVPVGVYGQLYIGGQGLARGYLNRPDLTDRHFTKSTAAGEERLYATGDLGRWLPGGEIELKGRMDDQLKIRGFRIEPAEIESALLDDPAVVSAAVIGRQESSGDKSLVAYIEYDPGHPFREDALRNHLRQRLPAYMIPAVFIQVLKMPLTISGKIDRINLSSEEQTQPARIQGKEGMQPETPMEEDLIVLWRCILDRDDISVSDNFFDLGGHSLKANQLVNRIYRDMGIEVTLADIFMNPTIRQQGKLIATLGHQSYQLIQVN